MLSSHKMILKVKLTSFLSIQIMTNIQYSEPDEKRLNLNLKKIQSHCLIQNII